MTLMCTFQECLMLECCWHSRMRMAPPSGWDTCDFFELLKMEGKAGNILHNGGLP